MEPPQPRCTPQASPLDLFSRYPCFRMFPVSSTGLSVISSIPAGIKAKQNHFQSVQCNPRNATHVHTHTDIQRGTDPSKTFQAVQYPWVDTTLPRGVLSAACKLHPSSLRGTHTECTHPHEWVWGSALCPGHGDGQGAESRRETQTFIHILSCFLQEKQTRVSKRTSVLSRGPGWAALRTRRLVLRW